MENLKIKVLTKEQLLISLDRLTRFKDTKTKYVRVFCDILVNNLIFPKFKRQELENMDFCKLKDLAEFVINFSIKELGLADCCGDYLINQRLYDYEKSVYHLSDETEKLLQNKINYKALVDLIDNNSVKNLLWLKMLATSQNQIQDRQKFNLRFPIEKVVIAEGATEEILLPEFAKLCGYNFEQHGVQVLSAGGKNQVVKLYYKLVDSLKLPIFILLDKDAKENLEEINPRLRKIDKIHLIDCGEFEDLLSLDLIKRTLEYELSNISILELEMLNEPMPKAKILEEVFKTRGMHEFKKVEFAQMIKNNIKSYSDMSAEIVGIIDELKVLGDNVTEFKEK